MGKPMNCMRVLIATAEREIYRGKARMVIAPSVEGELAIMPGHAPLLAILRPGEIRIDCPAEDGCSQCHRDDMVTCGGYLEVQQDAVIILADTIFRSAEIDAAAAQKAINDAKQALASLDKKVASKAMLDLELAIAKLRVVRNAAKKRGG